MQVLILGYNGVHNAGADLRSIVVARMLQPQASDRVCSTSLCTFDPEKSHDLLPGVKQITLGEQFLRTLTPAIDACDVVAISEGCAFFPKPFSLYAHALRLASERGKRAIVFGCSVGGLVSTHYTILAKASAGALIFTRDRLSYNRLQARGIDARFGADPVWAIDLFANSLGVVSGGCERSKRDVLAVCPGARSTDGVEYEWALTKALRPLTREAPIVAVSLDPADDGLCTNLAQRLGVRAVTRSAGFSKLLTILAKSRVVLSARYHGVVLGIVMGAIPVMLAADMRLIELGRILPWPELIVDWRDAMHPSDVQYATNLALELSRGDDVELITASRRLRAAALSMRDEARFYLRHL